MWEIGVASSHHRRNFGVTGSAAAVLKATWCTLTRTGSGVRCVEAADGGAGSASSVTGDSGSSSNMGILLVRDAVNVSSPASETDRQSSVNRPSRAASMVVVAFSGRLSGVASPRPSAEARKKPVRGA